MSQQKHKDTSDNSFSLNPKDAILTSANTSKETEINPTNKAKVIEKKSFSERWKTNRFWLIRGTYFFLRSVWLIVMFIGGFIAWLISLLFI